MNEGENEKKKVVVVVRGAEKEVHDDVADKWKEQG